MIVHTSEGTIAAMLGVLVLGMALGACVGATVAMSRMSGQVAECESARAECYELRSESLATAIATHGVVQQWACAARGVCK